MLRLWRRLPFRGLLHTGADLHNGLDRLILEALHMWGSQVGESYVTDGRRQVKTDSILVGNESGRRDIGFDGREPVLKELADRQFAGRDIDAALLIAQDLFQFVGNLVPSGLGYRDAGLHFLAAAFSFHPVVTAPRQRSSCI